MFFNMSLFRNLKYCILKHVPFPPVPFSILYNSVRVTGQVSKGTNKVFNLTSTEIILFSGSIEDKKFIHHLQILHAGLLINSKDFILQEPSKDKASVYKIQAQVMIHR